MSCRLRIAIAFGELIDASIVVVEQTTKPEKWEAAGRPGRQPAAVICGVKEVAAPTFLRCW
jgi:Cu/Ag efflux pump CusA